MRKDGQRKTMIVRMAQKKISAARRMEMIRRRSSVMREGGVIPPARDSTAEEGEGLRRVDEGGPGESNLGNDSSRLSAHRSLRRRLTVWIVGLKSNNEYDDGEDDKISSHSRKIRGEKEAVCNR